MKQVIPVVFSTLLLGGCALPAHIQVISWALDGVSYLMTEKSVTDHGLSIVAQQDCALWRLITEGEICRDEDAITAIAAADVSPHDGVSDTQSLVESGPRISWSAPATREELDVIEVAVIELDAPLMDDLLMRDSAIETLTIQTGMGSTPPRKPGQVVVGLSESQNLTTQPIADTAPVSIINEIPVEIADAGDYLVIGSFRMQDNAMGFARTNGEFDTKILPATVSGNQVYRVVVGPLATNDQGNFTSALLEAGLVETWPLNVPEARTAIAWRPPVEVDSQLASLPTVMQ